MSWEVRIYEDSLVEELIAVFNRETENDEFVVALTPEIFTAQVSSKPFFSPEGCFLAMENSKAVGFALTSPGADRRGGTIDPSVGVVDGLFFPGERLDYIESPFDTSSEWAQQSWKNHFPKVITAERDSVPVGYIGYVELPYLSEYRKLMVRRRCA